ncbi:MAG: type 4a pilus biogenesis protein PilO [Phycisphaerae bacterium]|nr:type 4a pilus biogenesis protein PilO [Phycisphaerae bacterium]
MKFGTREIVFIVVLTVIPVAAWWFVFRPADARNNEMIEQIETRQKKLQSLNRATATIGDLKVEISSLEDAIKFFRSKLPSEKEIDKVLQEVWRLAEDNKLTIKIIQTLKRSSTMVTLTDPSGPYAEQPILLQLEGPFTGFYGFLLAMETQPRIMRIQQMSIVEISKCGGRRRGKKASEDEKAKMDKGYVCADCVISVFFERSNKG